MTRDREREEKLARLCPVSEVRVFDTLDSTNAYALASADLPDRALIVACRQTAGRGRRGRSFFSPSSGLYLTLLLRPFSGTPEALTAQAGVAAAETVERFSAKTAKIKWVNDVFVENKKVCGILAQAQTDRETRAALGVGLNLFTPKEGFGELADVAGAAFDGLSIGPDEVTAFFLQRFFFYFDGHDCLEEYRRRMFLSGRQVSFGDRSGLVLGVDDRFRLLVREGERTVALSSGEVSVSPASGG